MRKRPNLLFFILLLACLISDACGETVYFLVGEISPARNESYVLPLSDANDIAYARNLIKFGPGIGSPGVVADIASGADGINRSFTSPTKAPWNWHVTSFVSFAGVTPEILDGWPEGVQRDVEEWINNTGGQIGFWDYTVIAELGTDTKPWRCDFNSDNKINNKDFAEFGNNWLREDCNSPDWCNGADLDNSGTADINDLAIFADNWLDPFAAEPRWFDCWDNPRQCHGDADGLQRFGCYVTSRDAILLQPCLNSPVYPGCECADFDRDGDVDDYDADILEHWLDRDDVPCDCATDPYL